MTEILQSEPSDQLVFSGPCLAEFFAAFAKAQSEMGDVMKDSKNPAFKTTYADLASVVGATRPALSSNGLVVFQPPAWSGDHVAVETIIAHTGGGMLRSTLRLKPTKMDPQGIGSAITYGRRYALMAICGVAPEDDDGNAASATQRGDQHDRRDEPAREDERQEQVTPTLAERANKLGAALSAAKSLQELNGIYDSAHVLRADLTANDAPRMAKIDKLTSTLSAKLPGEKTEREPGDETPDPASSTTKMSLEEARTDAEKVIA